MEINKCAAGDGFTWISLGWGLYKKHWWTWTLMLIVVWLLIVIAGIIPFLGMLLSPIASSFLVGGLIYGINNASNGSVPGVGDLFVGFKRAELTMPLLVLAILSAVTSLLGISLIVGSIFSGKIGVTLLIAFLVTVLGFAALMYACPLVVVAGIAPIEAMKLSLTGGIKNAIPLLVFGFIECVLIFLGSLPLMIGLLIAVPIAAIAHFYSFKSIYKY